MSQLLLHNAAVLTMDPARPRAEAVAVRDRRIIAAGSLEEAAAALDAAAPRYDCQGGELLPAFIDAHMHLLAYAATFLSIDCSSAGSIADIQQLLRAAAAETPAGRWLRAFSYEETSLAEKRHPNRHDLDAAAPEHPVRLIHASGHGSVLNSLGLRFAGIDAATEEPPGAGIGRDAETGEPNGVLLGMEYQLAGVVPPLDYDELRRGVQQAEQTLLASGIVCLQDGTHTNSRDEWELFERLISDGALTLDVIMMEGHDHLGALPEQAADGRLRRGAVKVMLHEIGGDFSPSAAELQRIVDAAHDAGRQVAIHAVSEPAVAAAATAIEAALRRLPRDGHRHRIEHASQLPDGLAGKLAALGVMVVSQPSLLLERGDRYLELIPEDEQPRLYAFRALRDAGVALAASSDAPVTTPDVLASVAAAVDRRAASGRPVAPEEAVCADDALSWWTAGAARSAFLEDERGAIRAGLRADFVLLRPRATDDARAARIERLWRNGVAVE